MANLIYRESTTATIPSTTSLKGSPLSNLEIDGNFRSINNHLSTHDTNISSITYDLSVINNNINIINNTKPNNSGVGATGTWPINITGNSTSANSVTNGVYTIGNQTIGGVKTFSSIISGSIDGNAATVTNGVYTNVSYANPIWLTEISGAKITAATIQTVSYADNSITTQKTAFTTQNQFDSSTRPATTQFVQKALGNFQNHITVTSNTYNISTSQLGSSFFFSTGSSVVSLPNMTGIPPGAMLYLSAYVPVSIVGVQLIDNRSNGGAGTIFLNYQEDVFLVWTGAIWYAIGGSYVVRTSSITVPSSMFGASMSQNGYQKLPSGLIIQWGRTPGGNGIYTYSFPIAFPNACLTILSQTAHAVPNDNDNITNGTEPISNSQFNITLDYGRACFWIAIGY